MSAEPWVPAPESVTCAACHGPVVLTARQARPVSRCVTDDCGLVVLGAYDLRLDERAARHPAVRAKVAREREATIDTLIERALLDGVENGG